MTKAKHKKFRQWVTRYHGSLYRHALWMTGNRDVAQDMVQEAFYQAWLSYMKLRDTDKALPWLLTILRRVIYREQRYQYRHADTVAALKELDQQPVQPDAYPLMELYGVLETLSQHQREVLLLHSLHGFSYEEISEHLQIPLGTVMSRISRAREALRLTHQLGEHNVIKLDEVLRGSGSDKR